MRDRSRAQKPAGDLRVLVYFGTDGDLEYYASEFRVEVFELHTGERVDQYTKEFGGPCPDEIEYEYSLDYNTFPDAMEAPYDASDLESHFDRLQWRMPKVAATSFRVNRCVPNTGYDIGAICRIGVALNETMGLGKYEGNLRCEKFRRHRESCGVDLRR